MRIYKYMRRKIKENYNTKAPAMKDEAESLSGLVVVTWDEASRASNHERLHLPNNRLENYALDAPSPSPSNRNRAFLLLLHSRCCFDHWWPTQLCGVPHLLNGHDLPLAN